eukprot:4067397-Amphidinium_carterae.1
MHHQQSAVGKLFFSLDRCCVACNAGGVHAFANWEVLLLPRCYILHRVTLTQAAAEGEEQQETDTLPLKLRPWVCK